MSQRADTQSSGTRAREGLKGEIVRALRVSRGLTLDELASVTHISKSHLSRFERGEKTVSVAALMRIAKALNTSVSALLGEKPHHDTVHVVRAHDAQPHWEQREGYRFWSLARADVAHGPEVFRVRLTGDAVIAEHAHHAGEEALLVLKGSVEIAFPSQSLVLREGDYIQFPGFTKHTIRGLHEEAEIFVTIMPRASSRG